MDTNQPVWKCIANLGDVDPLDHGGAFVMIDTTNHYPPELEIIETPEERFWSWEGWADEAEWLAYRMILEPHTYSDESGVLSDNKFHPDYEVWYQPSLASVCESTDISMKVMIESLTGDDPCRKALAYMTLANHLGLENFDSYPLHLSEGEADHRINRYLEQMNRHIRETR